MGFVFPDAEQGGAFSVPGCEYVETMTKLETNEVWINADDYREMSAETRIIADGLGRGLRRNTLCVQGKALGQKFPLRDGDTVTYAFDLSESRSEAILHLRYSLSLLEQEELPFILKIDGNDIPFQLEPTGDKGLTFLPVTLGNLEKGEHVLSLTYTGPRLTHVRHYVRPVNLVIDGFLIACANAGLDAGSRIKTKRIHPSLLVSKPDKNSLIIKANLLDRFYGLVSLGHPTRSWEFLDSDLEIIRKRSHVAPFQKVNVSPFVGNGRNHFAVQTISPIYCEAGASVSCYAVVGCGDSKGSLYQKLKNSLNERKEIESRILEQHRKVRYSPAKSPYAFSQEKMMSHTMINVYAPQERMGEYIKTFPPAKIFGGLYSWDAGFTGLGLLEYSPKLAMETMNIYFTEADTPEIPFIFHGTPLPVQIYLLWEIYQKTQRKDVLEYFYSKAKRFYQYIVKEFDVFGSGLLSCKQHFYSAAGADDDPPTVYIDDNRLGMEISHVSLNSHFIRSAKLLCLMAEELKNTNDIAVYESDIEHLSNALLKHSWHEESSYFACIYDKDKKPLLYEEHLNFNMTFDGVSPLIADICDKDKRERLIEHLQNPNELWTPIGLTAVSQSAPYFRKDGYWNGRVWMPHQWFFWKALIGCGELEFAEKIARTALELWECETQRTYSQWESFMIDTGHGAGVSQFSALSCPVLNFHAAYYTPGTVTVGYDVVVSARQFDFEAGRLSLFLRSPFREGVSGVILCMGKSGTYDISIDGALYTTQQTNKGTIQLKLSLPDRLTSLKIIMIT